MPIGVGVLGFKGSLHLALASVCMCFIHLCDSVTPLMCCARLRLAHDGWHEKPVHYLPNWDLELHSDRPMHIKPL
eukprot:11948549-Alexandrium_andersonii.AAC.1